MRLCLVCWFVRGVLGVGRVVPLQSGWHLDDLMRDSPSPPAAAVFVYSSDWSAEAWRLFGLRRGDGLPSRSHLFLGEYDIERRAKVWWSADDDDDDAMWLEERFNVTRAPAVVYVPAGGQRGSWSYYEMWDGGPQEWREWLAERLRFDVAVSNALEETVVRGDVALAPGETRVFKGIAPGQRLDFFSKEESKVLAASAIASASEDTTTTNLIVLSESRSADQDATELAARDARLNARDQDTTFAHSAIIRQPPIMPDFGKASYKLADMPGALRDRLWAFYRRHEASRAVEDYSDTSTGINQHVAPTTLVSLDGDFDERNHIATQLIQPLVEEWAGMPLEFTSFYGIREYYRNHELRMHVDRVATHVFSVIVNLHQEAIDSDWTLDVIDFDGSRKSLAMRPGQLLFYQSAKLVHGRPKPLNGSKFVNCFCHFKPKAGWDFVYGAGDILYKDGRPVLDYKVD